MANQRKLSNVLVKPKEQLQVIMTFVVSAVVLISGLTIIYTFSINSALRSLSFQADTSPAILRTLEASLSTSMYVAFALSGLLGIFIIMAGFALSHRLLGPSIQLRRLAQRLANGEYTARGKLRKGDAFHDVMDSLNSLASELEKRHGTPSNSQSQRS
jgi:two-component system, OmpR family, sensor histidine kinase BaeS